jgi:isoleucyl-tRNA synthetase
MNLWFFNILQTPLRELVVVHADPQYLADLKSLEQYIYEASNPLNLLIR